MLKILAVSLLLTLAVELLLAISWGLRTRRELAVAALTNLLTNPAAVLLYYTLTGLWGLPRLPVTLGIEIAVVLVEWQCYRSCSEKLSRPLVFALAANILSYTVGFIINLL